MACCFGSSKKGGKYETATSPRNLKTSEGENQPPAITSNGPSIRAAAGDYKASLTAPTAELGAATKKKVEKSYSSPELLGNLSDTDPLAATRKDIELELLAQPQAVYLGSPKGKGNLLLTPGFRSHADEADINVDNRNAKLLKALKLKDHNETSNEGGTNGASERPVAVESPSSESKNSNSTPTPAPSAGPKSKKGKGKGKGKGLVIVDEDEELSFQHSPSTVGDGKYEPGSVHESKMDGKRRPPALNGEGGRKGGKKGLATLGSLEDDNPGYSFPDDSGTPGGNSSAPSMLSTTHAQYAAAALSNKYNDLSLINRPYDYYIFDFDNVVSACLLGVRKNVSDECDKIEWNQAEGAYLRKNPGSPDAASGPAITGNMVVPDIEEVTAREFGGRERVMLLTELFSRLTARGKKYWILSRGRESRIKVALRNVEMLHFFDGSDGNVNPGSEFSPPSVGDAGGGEFDMLDCKSRILASDTLHRPKGLYKGDQIMNLLAAQAEANIPIEKVLFLDDNLGNLELAEDASMVYQPQAGAHGTGLSTVEIRCLISALD